MGKNTLVIEDLDLDVLPGGATEPVLHVPVAIAVIVVIVVAIPGPAH